METKFAQKPSTKRDGRKLCRCPRLRMSTMETFACHGEDGRIVRVKVVISKQEAGQLVASLARTRSKEIDKYMPMPEALEQLLHVLRRRQTNKAEVGWQPVLQSIPEEI